MCSEDGGFAIQPWTKVRFENTGFILEESRAIAMGNYFFTTTDGIEVKVEYTFGYILVAGELKIPMYIILVSQSIIKDEITLKKGAHHEAPFFTFLLFSEE